MGLLAQILQRRSPVVHTLDPDQVVADAVSVMASQEVGAVLVVEKDRLVGIFSERDLLRRVCARGRSTEETRLAEVMTPDPVTASPGESRLIAVAKMQRAGCRHLPIVVDGAIIDMLSMRDLLFGELEEREAEIEALRRYIGGSY
ncbi:MAG: CBS domain-containing protein [Myxococcota bacterium]